MTKISLNGKWRLAFNHPQTGSKTCFTADVPIEAEVVLHNNGLIGDLMPPDTPADLSSVKNCVWNYSRTFTKPAVQDNQEVWLVFDGIDPASEIYLNGKHILSTDNAMISHQVDITSVLQEENLLEVMVSTDADAAKKYGPPLPGSGHGNAINTFLRKARHVYGWDNAPCLPLRGICKDVSIEIKNRNRIEDIYIYTMQANINMPQAEVGYYFSFKLDDELSDKVHLELEFFKDGKSVFRQNYLIENCVTRTVRNGIFIDSPSLWFPRGYGKAELYSCRASLKCGEKILDTREEKFGIREIELVRSNILDKDGNGDFHFLCNGVKIYVRGTNWKVLNAIHSQSSTTMQKALDLTVRCNCNLIRVWGGGIYERDDFFNWCDENGMLVWQDFMFACEFPCRNRLYEENAKQEAEFIIKALRNHPSLALWCGDNEADNSLCWNNFIPMPIRPSDNYLSRNVLKDAVLAHDPWRNYMPSSPFIDDAVFSDNASRRNFDNYLQRVPEQHYYTGEPDYERAFDKTNALFISECGPFFYNALSETPEIYEREHSRIKANWNKSIINPELLYHQSDNYMITWCESAKKHLEFKFGQNCNITPDKKEDFITAINFSCAEDYKYCIEKFRREKFRRSGLIWWSLCDMWKMAFNYSAVDSNYNPKMPFFWIAASQEPRVIIGEKQNGKVIIHAANDTLEKFAGNCEISCIDAGGKTYCKKDVTFSIQENSCCKIAEIDMLEEHTLILFKQGNICNHLITGNAPFDFAACKVWIKILRGIYSY